MSVRLERPPGELKAPFKYAGALSRPVSWHFGNFTSKPPPLQRGPSFFSEIRSGADCMPVLPVLPASWDPVGNNAAASNSTGLRSLRYREVLCNALLIRMKEVLLWLLDPLSPKL